MFDENVFPFSALPTTPTTMPLVHSSLPSPDQFVDGVYSPALLPNHAAGIGRGARLQLLDDHAPDADQVQHVDKVLDVVHVPCRPVSVAG